MSTRKILVAALGVLGALVLFAFGAGIVSAKDKPGRNPSPWQIVNRTRHVIIHAGVAVKKGGEAKDVFRNAVHHQHAARWALRHRFRVAAIALTLKARALARQAIVANKDKPTDEEAVDAEPEVTASQGASEAEMKQALDETAKELPPADELLKQDDYGAGKEEKGAGEEEEK